MAETKATLPEGYRITELGPLPKEWEVVRLRDAVKEMTSGDWGVAEQSEGLIAARTLRGTDFVRAALGITENAPIRYLRESSVEKRRLLPGNTLIELSGGSKDQPTGRLLLISERLVEQADAPLAFSNFVKRLRIDEMRSSAEFFAHYWSFLYNQGRTRIYEKRTTGIRNFRLTDFLENENMVLPPLPEQRAIAHVLRTVQETKEATEQVIAATRELKKSLMRHLFTYGPVPIDETESVPLKETEVGPVPEHWEVVKLGEVAKIERGKFAHRPRNDPRFYGGMTPFIQTGDVTKTTGRITTYSQTLNELGLSVSRIFPKGTIVLTIAANIGDSAILGFDSAFPDSLVGITPDSTMDAVFLTYYLQTQKSEMDRLAPKGTQKNINIQFLRPWLVGKPPLPEQQEMVRILSAVDEKVSAEENRKRTLEALFKTLLHHLMTGKLRVETEPDGR